MEKEQIIIKPLVTEKSLADRALGRYVFLVHPRATKIAVKQAVEKIFKVKVAAVNTCFIRPRRRVMGRSIGQTARGKKAYVSLVAGQKIQELEV